MSKKGPIILVDDDVNDLDVIKAAIVENGFKNEIIEFKGAKQALEYLVKTTDTPFLILCDIIMQEMNGLEFRNLINHNDMLRKKSIPFIFLTAAVSQEIVDEAYDMTVQGFLKKPSNFNDLKTQLHNILTYWTNCVHPNSF